MTRDEGEVAVIDPGIMEVVDGRLRLIGGRCGGCAEIGFPLKDSCGSCGGVDVSPVRLVDHGVLWSWTVQRFPPPNPPYHGAADDFEPFGLGYVELPGQVIVEARLTESDATELRIGMPLRLTGVEVPTETGALATTFAFEPIREEVRQ